MKPISSWVNLQDVFKANEGHGAAMNEAVYGGLEQQGMNAHNALQKSAQGFSNAAEKSRQQTRAGMNGTTAAGADAAAQAQYGGPRSLKEFDPNVSNTIGDAAQRINASSTAQYANQYQTSTAGGGALDRAMMGAEGGQQRAAAVKGKYGGLLDELRAAQQHAQQTGQAAADDISGEASRLGALAPGMHQLEQQRAVWLANEQLYRKNNAERDAYDAKWNAENARMHSRRGNELAPVYEPPYSQQQPLYNDGSGDIRAAVDEGSGSYGGPTGTGPRAGGFDPEYKIKRPWGK